MKYVEFGGHVENPTVLKSEKFTIQVQMLISNILLKICLFWNDAVAS